MSLIHAFSPLEHFELNYYTYIYNAFYDFSITSSFIFLLSMLFFLVYFALLLSNTTVVPGFSQLVLENIFIFVLSIFKQQVQSVRALRFFPLMFTLFIYIFLLNFTSLYVYGSSLTGHIMVTMFFSFGIFFSLIIIGFLNYGLKFLSLFVPQNVPNVLLDFIIIIEIFSFAIRPFSLSIRLFANMLAGHTLMGIFAKFTAYVIKNFFIFF